LEKYHIHEELPQMKSQRVSKTLSLSLNVFAMLQQIMNKKGIAKFEDGIEDCVSRIYTQDGFGIP